MYFDSTFERFFSIFGVGNKMLWLVGFTLIVMKTIDPDWRPWLRKRTHKTVGVLKREGNKKNPFIVYVAARIWTKYADSNFHDIQ